MAKEEKTAREKILFLLEKARDGMTPIRVAEATGISHNNARQLLRRLARSGQLARINGLYCPSGRRTRKNLAHGAHREIRRCLERLTEERVPPAVVGPIALQQVLSFMEETCGLEFARDKVSEASD